MRHINNVQVVFVLILTVLFLQEKNLFAQKEFSREKIQKYVRVYSDSTGESHFEDLEVKLKEIEFAPPAPSIFTSEFNSSSKYGFISVMPGWESEWHPAPTRQYILYLKGTIEAQVSDGEIRQFGPGSITLIEDTRGKGHKSKVIGNDQVVCVVIQLNEE